MKADVDTALTWNIKQNSEETKRENLAFEEQKTENNSVIKKPSGKSKIRYTFATEDLTVFHF